MPFFSSEENHHSWIINDTLDHTEEWSPVFYIDGQHRAELLFVKKFLKTGFEDLAVIVFQLHCHDDTVFPLKYEMSYGDGGKSKVFTFTGVFMKNDNLTQLSMGMIYRSQLYAADCLLYGRIKVQIVIQQIGSNEEGLNIVQAGRILPEIPEHTILTTLDPSGREYIDISKKMLRTIHSHRGNAGGVFSTYNIIKIEFIQNHHLFQTFLQCRKNILKENCNQANEKLLFHGSAFINEIIKDGFDERHAHMDTMFGAGLYFASDSSKSNQYIFGLGGRGCSLHSDRSCYMCERKLLLARVVLRKSFIVTTPMALAHAPPKHHSVTGMPSVSGLSFEEYVVYKGEQAYPEYVITYTIVNPVSASIS